MPRSPVVRIGKCRMCRRRIVQKGRGNPRLFCKQSCRAKFYYRQDPAKQRARMHRRYQANPEKHKEYRRNYYQDVQKKVHRHRDRTVTWKVVMLPDVPVSFSPNFSGLGDPYGLLADMELRHLLADFEDERGNLPCLEPKEYISRRPYRDFSLTSPHYSTVDLDGWSGLPSYSDARAELKLGGHSERWPDAPPAG